MRGRDYKDFFKGGVFHIYNRGVNKMNIFLKDKDYRVFLFRAKENLYPDQIDRSKISKSHRRRKLLPPNSFHLISYCLMPNHFHILIQQKTDLPVTKFISKICTGFSMYFNKEYERIGAVFQDQFKAVLVENNEQLLWTSYYIHKNPVEAELVKSPDDYGWSSYLEYCNAEAGDGLCKKDIILGQFNSPEKYLEYFKKDRGRAKASLGGLYFDFDEDSVIRVQG